jgi:NAD+ dependent glucose-6-phosphate dehydrogenase
VSPDEHVVRDEPHLDSSLTSDLTILDMNDDSSEIEDSPRTILITGACGNLGRKLRAAWNDAYDLVLVDQVADPDQPDLIVADLAEPSPDWMECFHGADVVVHLAANPNEFAPWEQLYRPNIDAVANVLNAAILAGVERIVFASSNHAMGGYREIGDGPIHVDLDPRPGNSYGATKLMGERLGKSAATAYDLSFVALRIGWVLQGDNRPENLPDDWAKKLWLSNNDLVRLFDAAVEADLEPGSFVVVNGLSNNRGTRWDLSHTREAIGFEPGDDAFAEL